MRTAHAVRPDLLVVSATAPDLLTAVAAELVALSLDHTVAVAGTGAAGFDRDGVLTLAGDPVSEARRVSELVAAPGAAPAG